jgi:hypothetical protein
MESARRHFVVFLLRILGAASSITISLSVALKRPVRSFGAITDSRASSFTDGSARGKSPWFAYWNARARETPS